MYRQLVQVTLPTSPLWASLLAARDYCTDLLVPV